MNFDVSAILHSQCKNVIGRSKAHRRKVDLVDAILEANNFVGIATRRVHEGIGFMRPAYYEPVRPNSLSVGPLPHLSFGGHGRLDQCGVKLKLETVRPGGSAPLPQPKA